MGGTVAEQILAEASGEPVSPGETVRVECDRIASHDLSTPPIVDMLEEWGGSVHDPDRVVLVPDHMVPAHDANAQRNYTVMEAFAEDAGIDAFYPQTETGLMHVLLAEDGLVGPGDVVIGADSHMPTNGAIGAFSVGMGFTDVVFALIHGWTWLRVPESHRYEFTGTPSKWVRGKDLVLHALGEIGVDGATYKAVEFGGAPIEALPLDDRFSMCNMMAEGGAKIAFTPMDETVEGYLADRVDGPIQRYVPTDDATYADRRTFDCDGLEPQVARPDIPDNVAPVSDVAGVAVDQAVVGSCTNCRPEDLRQAAAVLEGHHVDPDVRLIVTPGSRRIQSMAFEEGWMQVFHDAGATIGSPGCGACFGEHIGVLDEGEVAISTTNRNFVGRMGAESSEVYLANPAVAAASAITGEITHPAAVA